MSRSHPLFQRYPLNGTADLHTGPAPTPYHIYDGYGLFIGGKADLAAARDLLRNEQVTPVQTADGKAWMGIWVCDFTDASLGPHHELQFSIFITRQPTANANPSPIGLLAAMLGRPVVQMMCHGLWNNMPGVVAYNRELLGLDARLSTSVIQRDGATLRFRVSEAHNTSVCSGAIDMPKHNSMRVGLALTSALGFRQVMAANQQPWVGMHVVNPIGEAMPRNATAHAFNKSDLNAVRYWDTKTDSVKIDAPSYASLHFAPQFVHYMEGFKFVYLQPDQV